MVQIKIPDHYTGVDSEYEGEGKIGRKYEGELSNCVYLFSHL